MSYVSERKVKMYKCDECNNVGEELSIHQCRLCGRDLCQMHVTRIIVSHSREAQSIVAFFCQEHSYFMMNELSDLLEGQIITQYKQEDLASSGSEEPRVPWWHSPENR